MYNIKPFWNDEYKHLEYKKMPFSNKYDVVKWRKNGYQQDKKYFTGQMVGHDGNLPTWNQTFLDLAKYQYELKDVGVCYYRMGTSEIIPNHRDDYKVYREKFNCEIEDITRIVIFLEDWKSGHYFEIDGHPIVNWKAGDSVMWVGNIEHMAANIGIDYRYTLQITGHR